MITYMTTDNPGTTLSCAALPTTTVGWGTGAYRAAEVVLAGRVRRVVGETRVPGIRHIPVDVDLPSRKQSPIRVPQRSQERSP